MMYFLIGPRGHTPRRYYAPSLGYAFSLARKDWGGADLYWHKGWSD